MAILPHYIHQVNLRLKHTYLSFDDAGTLIIRSPKISQREIERILLKKSAWINNARRKLAEKKGKISTFDPSTLIYYLGHPYSLIMHPHDTPRISLTFDRNTFNLYYHRHDTDAFHRHLNTFYKKELQRILPPLVEKWADRMGVRPAAITYRKTKRQWGSCSSTDRLSFNTMLAKVPIEAIEYVVVHELAHIRHKHHQKTFWQLIAHHLPDYKARIETLQSYTP
jgi:predicted metal-dependent hydrolase